MNNSAYFYQSPKGPIQISKGAYLTLQRKNDFNVNKKPLFFTYRPKKIQRPKHQFLTTSPRVKDKKSEYNLRFKTQNTQRLTKKNTLASKTKRVNTMFDYSDDDDDEENTPWQTVNNLTSAMQMQLSLAAYDNNIRQFWILDDN